jgi:hypothetical protein
MTSLLQGGKTKFMANFVYCKTRNLAFNLQRYNILLQWKISRFRVKCVIKINRRYK